MAWVRFSLLLLVSHSMAGQSVCSSQAGNISVWLSVSMRGGRDTYSWNRTGSRSRNSSKSRISCQSQEPELKHEQNLKPKQLQVPGHTFMRLYFNRAVACCFVVFMTASGGVACYYMCSQTCTFPSTHTFVCLCHCTWKNLKENLHFVRIFWAAIASGLTCNGMKTRNYACTLVQFSIQAKT